MLINRQNKLNMIKYKHQMRKVNLRNPKNLEKRGEVAQNLKTLKKWLEY